MIQQQILDSTLHAGTGGSMVDGSIGIVIALVILGVDCITQAVVDADLITVIIEVVTEGLAGDVVSYQRQVVAVIIGDLGSIECGILHSLIGGENRSFTSFRIGDTMGQAVGRTSIAILIADSQTICTLRLFQQPVTIAGGILVIAETAILMGDLRQTAIGIRKAGTGRIRLPRRLDGSTLQGNRPSGWYTRR